MKLSDLAKIFSKNPLDIKSIKEYLESEKIKTQDQLVDLKSEDPFMQEDRDLDNEPMTDASEIEGHDRNKAVRDDLKRSLAKINRALEKIANGNYEKCDKCGKTIDASRLKAMPMATVCMECERVLESHLA